MGGSNKIIKTTQELSENLGPINLNDLFGKITKYNYETVIRLALSSSYAEKEKSTKNWINESRKRLKENTTQGKSKNWLKTWMCSNKKEVKGHFWSQN